MPELAEIKIMSDFIDQSSKNRIYNKIYDVQKGNQFNDITNTLVDSNFSISTKTNGKELQIILLTKTNKELSIYTFMGMSGNWKFVNTDEIGQTKFIRLRFDTLDNCSLICYGGYMGPKWSVGKFKGTKRGPDPTLAYDKFRENILNNIDKKVFDKPVYEMLLNQEYFNGIGNYLRSSIIYHNDINPFQSGRKVIEEYGDQFFKACKSIPLQAYRLNGGQLKDWKNPFDVKPNEFLDWVFYNKGNKLKDTNGRTFWYDPKWESYKNNI